MNRLERLGSIALVGGLALFAVTVAVKGWLPWARQREAPIERVNVTGTVVPLWFEDLAARYPEEFKKHFGEPTPATFAKVMEKGEEVYRDEACWRCHTRSAHPRAGKERQIGSPSYPGRTQNALRLPRLFGAKRLGPDLIQEAGDHSNDWQVAHLWEPRVLVPPSLMPSFKWLFDPPGADGVPHPNARGLAIVAFIQWLGSSAEHPDAPLLQLDEARDAPSP
jgi:cytochrome c oxidase cbb3-type subunit I/II